MSVRDDKCLADLVADGADNKHCFTTTFCRTLSTKLSNFETLVTMPRGKPSMLILLFFCDLDFSSRSCELLQWTGIMNMRRPYIAECLKRDVNAARFRW